MMYGALACRWVNAGGGTKRDRALAITGIVLGAVGLTASTLLVLFEIAILQLFGASGG